jgi:hypothetical protein
MLAALTGFITTRASWPAIFLTAAAAAAGAWVDIRLIAPAFAAATSGIPVFDLQPGLQPEQIWQQLPRYTAESIRIYWQFFWLDMAFPLAAFTTLALLWAKLLPITSAAASVRWGVTALVPFLTLLFDWAENLAFMSLVQAYPAEPAWLAALACGLHFGKFVCLAITNAGIVLLALAALVTRVQRRARPAVTARQP